MSNVASVLANTRAEALLAGSVILEQIEDLKAGLTLPSDGKKLNFDDFYTWLQQEIEKIPRLKLLAQVPSQQEGNYTVQLIEALDQIQERTTAIQNRVIAFQTRLVEVDTAIKATSAAFEAWYLLALDGYLNTTDLKLPQANRKALATSEFNRLMGGAPVVVATLQVAVKAEAATLEAKKKMAREKFELGREQVNASWMNRLPGNTTDVSGDFGSLRLLETERVDAPGAEEEEDLPPTFVSQRPRLTEPPSLPLKQPLIDVSALERLRDATGDLCSIEGCGKPQFTTPSGTTCENGHGGAEPRESGSFTGYVEREETPAVVEAIAPKMDAFDVELSLHAAAAEMLREREREEAAKEAAKTEPEEPVTQVIPEDTPEPEAAKEADFPAGVVEQALARMDRTGKDVTRPLIMDAETTTYVMGVDLASGLDQTVASLVKVEDGMVTRIESILLDETMTQVSEAIVQQQAAGLGVSPGFFKTGTSQLAAPVTPEAALEIFSDDDGVDPDEIVEQIEMVEDEAVISAESAAHTAAILRTPTPSITKPVEMIDELDDLLTRNKPAAQPVIVTQTTPVPTNTPPVTVQRKKLSFVYED